MKIKIKGDLSIASERWLEMEKALQSENSTQTFQKSVSIFSVAAVVY